jgi:transcriptional regulator GlxA family with amidase domain
MGYHRPQIQMLGSLKVFLKPDATSAVTSEKQMNVRMDWRVHKLKDFIDGQDGKVGSDLEQMCQQLELGITAGYAGKLFTRYMNIGLREYAMQQRFRKAAEKLKITSCSIKEISADLGYRSPRDFSRGFKKAFNLSPIEYRRVYHLAKGFFYPMARNDPRGDQQGQSSIQLSLHAGVGKR